MNQDKYLKLRNIKRALVNHSKNFSHSLHNSIHSLSEKHSDTAARKEKIAEYRKKIKIYDVFNFFNELETLEIRFNILNDYVDYFVVVESTLTHSGMPKELFYEKNKHLFKEFEHKIIHFVIDTPLRDWEDAELRLLDKSLPEIERKVVHDALTSPTVPDHDSKYLRDYYEKESVKKPLINLADDDFCYISDLDEIWNPEALVDYSTDAVYKFKQIVYSFYLNNRSNEWWTGTTATKYKNIRNKTLNDLKSSKKTKHTIVANGGWHFTFQGGPKKIKSKIEAYSYHEVNTSEIKSQIESNLSKNKDVLGRHFKFWIDEKNLPKYILSNREKYKELFK